MVVWRENLKSIVWCSRPPNNLTFRQFTSLPFGKRLRNVGTFPKPQNKNITDVRGTPVTKYSCGTLHNNDEPINFWDTSPILYDVSERD